MKGDSMWEKLADPDHPIWKLLGYVVVGIVLTILCATMYRNGYDPKDLLLLLGVIGGMLGFDVGKAKVVTALGRDK